MDVKIYQINSDRDNNRVKFLGMDSMAKYSVDAQVNPSIYDEVFHAPLDVDNPEEIYRIFNTEMHPLFRGHSLSVSDVVVLDGQAHFCDTIGFKEIPFDESLTQKPENLMRVLYVEPHKPAYEAEIENTLAGMQRAVQGDIEPVRLSDDICLVGNEESQLLGMEGNRRIHNGKVVIAGPFFIAGDTGDEFRSLTDEEVVKYMAEFAEPEEITGEEVGADMYCIIM